MADCKREFHIAGDYIENQTNHFYDHSQYNSTGAVMNEKTSMPKAEKPSSPRKPRLSQPKPVKEHGVAHDTFLRGRFVTDNHLNALLHVMQQEGWIGNTTSAAQFRGLFSGKSCVCEIVWTGGGIGNLKELFRSFEEEQLIALPAGARSVNSVLENHVVDEDGHFIADLNHSRPADSAFQTIAKFVGILKARLDMDDMG